MQKKHFVLIEIKEFKNHLTLLPMRDYLNENGNQPNNDSLSKKLLDNGFTKIESDNHIIYVQDSFSLEEF